MIQSIKWVERKFDFDFPVGVLPWIVERLRGTPARIEESIRDIRPEILIVRPDGKWSIQENIGHLVKVEELHDGRIDDYLDGKETLRAADMENRATINADFNSQDIESIVKSFRRVRKDFVRRLEEIDIGIAGRSVIHPRLNKPMRLVDMAFFAAEHDDYHLAVIRRLAGNFL
jgi:hypothetical protein